MCCPGQFQMSQESIVPKQSSPFACSRAPSTLSSIHFTLVPENRRRTSSRPVFFPDVRLVGVSLSWLQMEAVRRSCQTMALWMGSRFSGSNHRRFSLVRNADSRYLPGGHIFCFSKKAPRTLSWVFQISLGSCSTQPGLGYICVNSCCSEALMLPSWSKDGA